MRRDEDELPFCITIEGLGFLPQEEYCLELLK